MKIVALSYAWVFAQISTCVFTAPSIIYPSMRLLNRNVLGNLTLLAHNVSSNIAIEYVTLNHTSPIPAGAPPLEKPFYLHIPTTDIILNIDYIRLIYYRIQHQVREALRRALR